MNSLTAGILSLRIINENDLPILHLWRNSDQFMTLCSTRRNTVTFDEFRHELAADFERDRHAQYLILRKGIPIGTIYSYNLNKTDGYVFTTIYLVNEHTRKGYGVIAFALFMNYLFQSQNLHKIYTEAYSYNVSSLQAMRNAGFVEEGTFKEHRLLNGRRYHLVRLAFFRDSLPNLQRFLTRLTA